MIHNLNAHNETPKPVQINENDLEGIACKSCGNTSFLSAIKLFRMSALHPQNQSNQEQVAHRDTLICSKCNSELDLTKEVKN